MEGVCVGGLGWRDGCGCCGCDSGARCVRGSGGRDGREREMWKVGWLRVGERSRGRDV